MPSVFNSITNRHTIDSTTDERMQTERLYRLLEDNQEIKRKMLTPAKVAQNNAALEGGKIKYRWVLV